MYRYFFFSMIWCYLVWNIEAIYFESYFYRACHFTVKAAILSLEIFTVHKSGSRSDRSTYVFSGNSDFMCSVITFI